MYLFYYIINSDKVYKMIPKIKIKHRCRSWLNISTKYIFFLIFLLSTVDKTMVCQYLLWIGSIFVLLSFLFIFQSSTTWAFSVSVWVDGLTKYLPIQKNVSKSSSRARWRTNSWTRKCGLHDHRTWTLPTFIYGVILRQWCTTLCRKHWKI